MCRFHAAEALHKGSKTSTDRKNKNLCRFHAAEALHKGRETSARRRRKNCAVFMPLKYSIRAEKRQPGGRTRQSERSSEQPTDHFIFSLEKSAQ